MRDFQIRAEAIRLRNEERRSIGEICKQLGVQKSTVHYWISRAIASKLTAEELSERRAKHYRTLSENARVKREAGRSKYYDAVTRDLTSREKGQIAEAAILFRLTLHGFEAFRCVFEGYSTDWMVLDSTGKTRRIQVKWMTRQAHGQPFMTLVTRVGTGKYRRYRKGEVDFLVGYDLYSDTAYVFDAGRVTNLKVKTAELEAKERWDLLRR
jgi:transposase-like protein